MARTKSSNPTRRAPGPINLRAGKSGNEYRKECAIKNGNVPRMPGVPMKRINDIRAKHGFPPVSTDDPKLLKKIRVEHFGVVRSVEGEIRITTLNEEGPSMDWGKWASSKGHASCHPHDIAFVKVQSTGKWTSMKTLGDRLKLWQLFDKGSPIGGIGTPDGAVEIKVHTYACYDK